MSGARPPQAASLLESPTKLGRAPGGGWVLSLYIAAAEASGSFRSSKDFARREGRRRWHDETRSEEEASRRARGKVRRYCAANGLNRLGTLTYSGAGNHDPGRLRTDVAGFFRSLRGRLGEPFPYLWVPEWHPGGHGLHVHFGVGRYVHRSWIEESWGRGFVHIKLLGDLSAGSTRLDEARVAARYLGKYAGKDLVSGRTAGLHRYEVAQGFQPQATAIKGRSADEVLGLASAHMGREPTYVWQSWNEPQWFGPSAIWASWDA